MSASRGRALAAVLLVVATATGCSGAVEVAVPDAASDPACAQAAAEWPTTIDGHDQVETDPASPALRAWGDPAIIARCGVPALTPTTDPCVGVNGVDWVAEDLSDGTRLTTYGRDPAIEVLVPSDYGSAAMIAVDFEKAAKALPKNGHNCV
ncbi:DUF3515 family protein [Janibacter sp. GXQ6167]|uniref:DUF3515 family protein n=1 Tax=Janibacter sp. GXQ6167 TaxID=3240791 RepID=UPI0035241A61